jgi:DNA-binding CsgD family transcriptional regulator
MAEADGQALTLTEDEVRGVVRLLAEALTPDDGRAAKVGRVMDGLCGMVGAEGWVWVRSRLDDLREPINIDYLYGGGLEPLHMARLAERMLNVLGPGSEFGALGERFAAHDAFSVTRPQLTDDRRWREDPSMVAVRASGLDEVMYSWFPLPDGDRGVVWSGGWFYRTPGGAPFDPRACRIAHLVMAECGVLHAEGLDLSQEPKLKSLTHKQRLVLNQLVDGSGVKQIALHLQLSPHTVNDHVKAIYRHFNVQSRAELMRRFIVGGEAHGSGV